MFHIDNFKVRLLELSIKSEHDDVIKWNHFPCYWPFVWGIHRSPVNSSHKGQWRGALMFFFDLRLNKRLRKQSWGYWFETLSRPLWRHFNEILISRRYSWLGRSVISHAVCFAILSWVNVYRKLQAQQNMCIFLRYTLNRSYPGALICVVQSHSIMPPYIPWEAQLVWTICDRTTHQLRCSTIYLLTALNLLFCTTDHEPCVEYYICMKW